MLLCRTNAPAARWPCVDAVDRTVARHSRTLMEAGKGGNESGAVTVSARMRPKPSASDTCSAPSTGVCSSTVDTASGMEIILYLALAIVQTMAVRPGRLLCV